MSTQTNAKKIYEKPQIKKIENIRAITCGCPDWHCSVTVPPPPAA
ncbi:MAG: hypothetical protein ACYC6Z_06840 [Thermoleophilia bacterium]